MTLDKAFIIPEKSVGARTQFESDWLFPLYMLFVTNK